MSREAQYRPRFSEEMQPKPYRDRQMQERPQVSDELISELERLKGHPAIPGEATVPMMAEFKMFP